MKLSGAEIIIKLLEKAGIDKIAGIPGGSNLPIYEALFHSKIKHILTRHEQAAGFIAQGIARASGKPGVCIATSGPGATNLITSIADADMDSIPIIAITGQVSSKLLGTDAFQEVDIIRITKPITKKNYLISKAEELLDIIPEAFRIAVEGRPGPVLIDIPKDIQTSIIDIEPSIFNNIDFYQEKQQTFSFSSSIIEKLERIIRMIDYSEKPVIYAGGGIIHSDSSGILLEFAKKNSIPITTTLLGLGSVCKSEPLNLGMPGMNGAPFTNHILNECDLLLAFGVRFDDRATCCLKKFCKNAIIAHIDIDASELNKLKTAQAAAACDIKNAIDYMLPRIKHNQRECWLGRIDELKKKYPVIEPAPDDINHPVNIIKEIGKAADEDAIIITDVGQHQMWTAQFYPFRMPRTFLTSGGFGTMGFGLPAAIGAALVMPEKQIICISGDGSIFMNIQELATLAELKLNIKIIIFNNNHLGLVRQQQELFYNKTFIGSKFIAESNFRNIARAFGINGIDIREKNFYNDNPPISYHSIFSEAFNNNGPCLIDIPIDSEINVLPMVPPGAGIIEMIS